MFQLPAASALAPAALLVSILIPLSGCTGSTPGSDPQVRQRFTHVADQISDLQSDLDDNRLALDELTQSIEALRAGDLPTGEGVAHAELATLRSADQQITEQMRALQETLDTLSQEIRDLRQQTSDNAIIAQRAAASATVRPTANRPAETPRETIAPREEFASAPASQPERRSAPRFTSYTVRQNDTLASIAERHDTTVSELVQANLLPSASVRPVAGSSLYVPQ